MWGVHPPHSPAAWGPGVESRKALLPLGAKSGHPLAPRWGSPEFPTPDFCPTWASPGHPNGQGAEGLAASPAPGKRQTAHFSPGDTLLRISDTPKILTQVTGGGVLRSCDPQPPPEQPPCTNEIRRCTMYPPAGDPRTHPCAGAVPIQTEPRNLKIRDLGPHISPTPYVTA